MSRLKRSHLNRERLLDEGVAILSTQGYHGTGLKQILDSVKIPKGSFYNYFESKDDYGAEVIRHYTDQVVAQCDAFIDEHDADGLAALEKYLDAFIEKSRQNGFKEGCLLGNLGAEVCDAGDSCLKALKEGLARVQERFEHALERAQKAGIARTDMDAVTMAELLLNAWEGAVMRMRVEKSLKPLEEIRELLLKGYFKA